MDSTRLIERFHQGHCIDAYRLFGAHFAYEGKEGVRFTVYAPHARNVSVIGSFTDWHERPAMMQRTDYQGVWSVFVPGAKEWDSYKYTIEDRNGRRFDKADPYAFYAETRPETASKIYNPDHITWTDAEWMDLRTKNFDRPVSIYEVYAGGWKKNGKYPFTYPMLEKELIPYVKEHGFTHIELMPLNEHPFDGSWGYQVSGMYAVTSRYGNPDEFAHFVNACHNEGIGVIMDIVPVHFVKDAFGLASFDGQPLYEYPKSYDAESEWGTLNFNLWSEEVRSFLMSAAAFWCDLYHMDGLRVDAVSHLIYWGGNSNRGVNEGALYFMKRMNYYLGSEFPDVMLIAEDSTDFPKVTASTLDGGLGFDYKWDLGWMHDTLSYYEKDPLYRCYEHGKLAFSMAYFYSEKFLMPLSHDENVHGKKTVIDRMWGTYDQKFSQARNLYAYMFSHPGKKLNFMGSEFASFREFDEKRQLDWELLDYPKHDAFRKYFDELHRVYLSHSCLWSLDYDWHGFRWIDDKNAAQSVYSFYREDEKEVIAVVLNMVPDGKEDFQLRVPYEGTWREILNSEDERWEGCGMINRGELQSESGEDEKGNVFHYVSLTLAPFGACYLHLEKER